MYKHLTYQKVHFFVAALLIPVILVLGLKSSSVHAGINIQDRFDAMSNPSAGVVAQHTIGFTFSNTSTPIGSILIQFCDNGPLPSPPGPACNFPTGMDVSNATLQSETGNTGYTIASTSGGQILLTNGLAPIP